MCLLSVIAPGVLPNLDHLAAGAEHNRDGHGYAIVSKGTLIVRKSMSPGPLIEEFGRMRAEHPDGPAMFHSRMGTGGVRSVYNCHPFFLAGDSLTVVGHNGVLWGHQWGDRRCDTRQFAEGLLPAAFRDLDQYSMRLALEDFLSYNKVAILTANPDYDRQYYIFNEDRGSWMDGVWHSNSDYMSRRDVYSRRRSPVTLDEGEDESGRCEICWRYGCIDGTTNACTECGCCQDCYEHVTSCLCYSIRNHRVAVTTVPSVPIIAGQEPLALTTGREDST